MTQEWTAEGLARDLQEQGALTYRRLAAEIRARGGTVDNNALRALVREVKGGPRAQEQPGTAPASAETPLLPAPIRDAVGRLEVAIVSQLATVRTEEEARGRDTEQRVRAELSAEAERLGAEVDSLLSELQDATGEAEDLRQQLTREQEGAASLRQALTAAEAERRTAADQVQSIQNTLQEEAAARREAETAAERLRGEIASVTTDRDAARERVSDLQGRLQGESQLRIRAESERDAARQQAEAMRETVVELRTRLQTTEEIQNELRAALDRLGRQTRGRKTAE
jgi:chromosome segregation ATPase